MRQVFLFIVIKLRAISMLAQARLRRASFLYVLNAIPILSNRLIFDKRTLKINQITRITGIGKVHFGSDITLGYRPGGRYWGSGIEIQARGENSEIRIGDGFNTNNNIFICAAGRLVIGKDCLIGEGVTIMDFEAHGIQPDERKKPGPIENVSIGNNVWIGNNTTILKGTSIGDNCIVAAGAVVKGKFENNVIIGGIPAKIIKQI